MTLLRILNALFLATAKAGAKGSIRDPKAREISIQVGEQHVEVSLDYRKSDASKKGRGEASKIVQRLHLQIRSVESNDVRTSWSDGEEKSNRIEKWIADIAVGVLVCGEINYRRSCESMYQWRIKRRAQLEEEIKRRKVEAERKEQERRAALEKARIDNLLQQSAALQNAKEIRTYVEAVRTANERSADPIPDSELRAWSMWAVTQADRIDPIKSRSYLALMASDSADIPSGLEQIDEADHLNVGTFVGGDGADD